jgi:membrane-bound serine protease (ClpP class)
MKRIMRHTLIALLLVFSSIGLIAQSKKVLVMDIKSEIDTRTDRYVELALAHAEKTQADIVLIEMNTYGGVLTDAKTIGDRLLAFKKPIWIFVNPNAATAGALISISCDSIYMSPGASIGAATVVNAEGEKAIDKYQSYMRAYMRTAATTNHRNPRIAEGMVDESIQIDSVKEEGKIITFSTPEAIKNGYCEGQVTSIDEILKKNKIENAAVEHFELSNADGIIEFFMNPLISGILILVILGGLYFELQAPGTVFPAAAATVALLLYLVPYYMNGLAENWEILVFFVGVVLLALEIFVIPGFGVAGIAGITLTVTSLVLMMVNNDVFDFEFVKAQDIMYATLAAVAGLLGGIILLFVGSAQIANSKAFQRMALTDTQQREKGYTANFNKEPMIGKTGIAFSVLRPSGRVMIDNTIYDAFTKGGYVEKGKSIEVIGEEGSTLRVKAIE